MPPRLTLWMMLRKSPFQPVELSLVKRVLSWMDLSHHQDHYFGRINILELICFCSSMILDFFFFKPLVPSLSFSDTWITNNTELTATNITVISFPDLRLLLIDLSKIEAVLPSELARWRECRRQFGWFLLLYVCLLIVFYENRRTVFIFFLI